MNWMEGFISQCLEGVPEGAYRTRTEKELQDHLLALCQELEQSGYALGEARALAQERMGDPAELAPRYLREWKRRGKQRRLFFCTLWLFGISIGFSSPLYIFNARNFGKDVVAYYGLVAAPVAALLVQNCYGTSLLFGRNWTVMRLCCLVLTAMQLPPIHCWIVYRGTYEMSGVMVPGWAGLLVHVLFFFWGLANYSMVTRFQREDHPAKQSA